MSLYSVTNQINNLQITKTKYTFRAYSTSAIPPPKIAKCMTDTIYLTDSKNLEDLSKLKVPSLQTFWICLRNTNTGDEQMHTKNVDRPTLKRWSQLFANSNLLKNVNLYGKYSFPKLKTPDPEVELWEQTAFRIDNTDFLATVVVDPDLSLKPDYDYVHFCLKTPWLPQTYDAFKNLATSNSRKLVLYHYGIAHYLETNENFKLENNIRTIQDIAGKNQIKRDDTENRSKMLDYSLATTIHGEAIADQSQWQSLTLEGCFKSTNLEKSAGSAVVPAVLGMLYPYLMVLDDSCPIDYNVVQPCKFSYIFYLEKLAGCRIWGAVNMCASEEALVNTYDQYPFKSTNSYLYSGHTAYYLHGFSVEKMKKMLANVQKNANTLTEFYVKDNNKQDLRLFLEFPLVDDQNEPSSKTRDDFIKHLQFYGLKLMERDLEEAIKMKETIENTQIVDHFLKQLLNCLNEEPFSVPTENKTWTTVINALVSFLVVLVDQFYTEKNPTLSGSSIYNKIYDEPSKTITYDQGIAFVKSCMGLPPTKWFDNVKKELDLTATQLLKVILFMPSIFKLFFKDTFFEGKNTDQFLKNKLGAYLAQNQTTFQGSIIDNNWTTNKSPNSPDEAKLALIYKCFEQESTTKKDFGWK